MSKTKKDDKIKNYFMGSAKPRSNPVWKSAIFTPNQWRLYGGEYTRPVRKSTE